MIRLFNLPAVYQDDDHTLFLPTRLFTHVMIRPSNLPAVFPDADPTLCLSIRLFTHMMIRLYNHPAVRPDDMTIRPSFYPAVYPYDYQGL